MAYIFLKQWGRSPFSVHSNINAWKKTKICSYVVFFFVLIFCNSYLYVFMRINRVWWDSLIHVHKVYNQVKVVSNPVFLHIVLFLIMCIGLLGRLCM